MPPVQLYDLQSDMGERRNVYDGFPEVVERLEALPESYRERGRSTPCDVERGGSPRRATAQTPPSRYCLSAASAASSARPPARMPSMPMLPSWQAYSYITWSVIRSNG